MIYPWLDYIFGLSVAASSLSLWHFLARAFLIYFGGIVLVRLHPSFIGMNTPFNFMVNFIVGSILANAIIAEGSYFELVAICLSIILANWFIDVSCYYSKMLEWLFKGSPDLLVDHGAIIWKNMRKNSVTHDELLQAAREAECMHINEIKKAYFEINGTISVIK